MGRAILPASAALTFSANDMNMIRHIAYASVLLLAFGFFAPLHATEITGREMTLPATERAVKVIQFRAAGEAKRPSVLILHGAGGFDRRIDDYNRYAAAVASSGIDAYLVYYYSAADLAAQGSVFEERYPAWAKLVGDLADHLLGEKASNGKVGLIGFSNGGILATGSVVLDAKINAAVIYYGTEPWPLPETIARRYPPLLVLHGDADAIIPVNDGLTLAENARALGTPVDLVIYPKEGHGFGSNIASKNGADALMRTIAFLKKQLTP
jgi:carboxymethylenebutenolidase